MRLTEAARQLQLQKWTTLIQEYKDSGMKVNAQSPVPVTHHYIMK